MGNWYTSPDEPFTAFDKLPLRPPPAEPTTVFFPQLDNWESIKVHLESLKGDEDGRGVAPVEKMMKVMHAVSPERLELKNLEIVLKSTEFNTHFPEFFSKTLKEMVNLALLLPELQPQIPILKVDKSDYVTLPRRTVACLLSHAFFCTFHPREAPHPEYSYLPLFNFTIMYMYLREDYEQAKFYAIVNYFRRIAESGVPRGKISVFRNCLTEFPNFRNSTKELVDVEMTPEGVIENAEDSLQVDFANSLIGGGILCGGCVQEEIRFAFCPELIIACLFCERMRDNEAIVMVGCEQFSEYSGYGKSLKYKGNYLDPTSLRDFHYQSHNFGAHVNTEITAIDAIDFRSYGLESQYTREAIQREIRKAYVGFLDFSLTHDPSSVKPVATGHWGCGVFGGNKAFKSIIQILAASEAGRSVKFFSFGDKAFVDRFNNTYKLVKEKKKTVGDIYNSLLSFHRWKKEHPKADFFDMLNEEV